MAIHGTAEARTPIPPVSIRRLFDDNIFDELVFDVATAESSQGGELSAQPASSDIRVRVSTAD